ncbi:MAG: DNA-binding transcriptional regulator, CsgD family [Blastococcus sp.]|jgi:DNA-binding CsgD family transcriptional regulator|nr:DNA-binding transcriptional regulator, CsgD family [Blastococcus sp.]
MDSAEIVREVDGIAAEPGTLAERAEALLAQLQRVVRFDAGWIALLPPDQDEHVSLARVGYDERVSGYLDSASVLGDVELAGLRRPRRPIRGCDMPFPPAELPGWADYLAPAGFRDGVTAGLFTPHGHYLGLLALHTEVADQVSDVARDLIGLLAAPIAFAVDPLRSMATVARLVHGAAAGILLAPSGALLPLPGLPGHRLLAPGSGVLVAAALQLAEGGPYASFLAPAQGTDGAETVRITVLAAPRELELFAPAVVLISPAGDLHGLSHRELQLLGLLVTGASDEWIAVAMGIATDAVARHLDRVGAKLVASSRTAAAARALRLGMFMPSSFFVRD